MIEFAAQIFSCHECSNDCNFKTVQKPKLDAEVQESITKSLGNYYALKNALIADDGNTANVQAGENE